MPRLLPTVQGIRRTFSGASDRISKDEKDKLGASQSTVSLTEGEADWIVRKTETRVAEAVANSNHIRKNCRLYKLPRFRREDLELGELIASGGFCEVREIKSFKVSNELERSCAEPKRFVIKHLAPKLVSKPRQLSIGAKDLVMEGFVLSSLSHENIIEIKGYASTGVSGYSSTGRIDGFFLVLPRLDKTLHKQLHEWKVAIRKQRKQLPRSSSQVTTSEASTTEALDYEQAIVSEALLGGDDESNDDEDYFNLEDFPFFGPRIQTSVEIASAIAYCHRHRILYRDLKPANIGYSFEEDRVKLFDFGLATELPPSEDPNRTFKLAGNTGTARYMAPEVVKGVSYGLKADVFSFCMLLHEIMALVKPFDKLTGKEVKEQVAVMGRRPVINKSWPLPIRNLLSKGFSPVPEIRPNMEDILDILEDIVDCL